MVLIGKKEDFELEKLAVNKINQLLLKSKPSPDYTLEYHPQLPQPIVITGSCLGRRCWDSVLQYVKAACSGVWESSVAHLYRPLYPFWNVESTEELVMKLDLVLGT